MGRGWKLVWTWKELWVTPTKTTGNKAPGLPGGAGAHPQPPPPKGSSRSSLGFVQRGVSATNLLSLRAGSPSQIQETEAT